MEGVFHNKDCSNSVEIWAVLFFIATITFFLITRTADAQTLGVWNGFSQLGILLQERQLAFTIQLILRENPFPRITGFLSTI